MSAIFSDFLKHLGFHAQGDALGECLQFGSRAKATTAILGLDFGTSCSKAVIHLPYVPSPPALAVPLACGLPIPYLARTTHFQHDGKNTQVTVRTHSPRPNPKVDLLVNPEDELAQAVTVILLSRLMRAARKWFLEKQRRVYGAFHLDWRANIGVPSSGYENRRIEEVMLACARAAWELSKQSELPDLACAKQAIQEFGDSNDSPVGTMPEIAAAAVAYARSIFSQTGMHVMLDVGASTLDICGFMLRPGHPSEPFGIFSTVVEHLGAAVLHDDRVRAVTELGDGPGPIAMGDPRDPAFEVPDSPLGYVEGASGAPEYLAELDSSFQEQCATALRTVLAGLFKMNRYGHWKDGVPVFMTGGGGRMSFYRKNVEDIPVKRSNYAWHRVGIAELTRPPNLKPANLPVRIVDRLMVAYGLSVPGGGGITFINPASLPEVPPPPRRRLDHRYVSKDMV